MQFLNWLIGRQFCPHCGRYRWHVARRYQGTAYIDNRLNYVSTCIPCYDEVIEYWEEMWDDYYRGRL